MSPKMSTDTVSILLSNDEALVLFDWLSNETENAFSSPDVSVRNILWKIEGQLEKLLTQQFDPRYLDLLAEAKKAVEKG